MLFLFALLAIPMSDQPALSGQPKERYVFVENTDRWVEVHRGERVLLGKLDKNGDFVLEYNFRKGQPWNLGFVPTIITFPGMKPKKAFEFRSGLLIPGELQPDGRFVPEAGDKIISFKDYEYSPTARPIWNLPGVFLTEEQAAELKKPKPHDKK
jgi:hypothetical protein